MNYDDAINLVSWYKNNKRSLPWRDTGNPYHVWISEIMLQQTRIEAVKPKYTLFMETLPTIEALANVSEDQLLKLWEGLGYYSRARNLKKCAETLMTEYNGQLPQEYDVLVKLPGIGPYTAGAISSIAYNKPSACVDGNVMRILSRYACSEKDIRDASVRKEMEQSIQKLFHTVSDDSFYADFNQGLMELGETVCIPNGQPNCSICPLSSHCKAYLYQKTDEIPYRSSLKNRKVINRTVFIIQDAHYYLIAKRDSKGLLANLYEFIGFDSFMSEEEIRREFNWMDIISIEKLSDSKHIFTHLEWHMKGYRLTVNEIPEVAFPYIKIKKEEITDYAIPSAFRSFTKQLKD